MFNIIYFKNARLFQIQFDIDLKHAEQQTRLRKFSRINTLSYKLFFIYTLKNTSYYMDEYIARHIYSTMNSCINMLYL